MDVQKLIDKLEMLTRQLKTEKDPGVKRDIQKEIDRLGRRIKKAK